MFASVSSAVLTAMMMAPKRPEVRHVSLMALTNSPPPPSLRAWADVLMSTGVSSGNGSFWPPMRFEAASAPTTLAPELPAASASVATAVTAATAPQAATICVAVDWATPAALVAALTVMSFVAAS